MEVHFVEDASAKLVAPSYGYRTTDDTFMPPEHTPSHITTLHWHWVQKTDVLQWQHERARGDSKKKAKFLNCRHYSGRQYVNDKLLNIFQCWSRRKYIFWNVLSTLTFRRFIFELTIVILHCIVSFMSETTINYDNWKFAAICLKLQ